jgi:hypothetical protein
MPREIRILGYIIASVVVTRVLVLLLDSVAEAVERQSLYH